MAIMYFTYTKSPIGKLLLAGDESGIKRLYFPNTKPQKDWQKKPSLFEQAEQELQDYFAGRLQQFNIKLKPEGTIFQLKVLKALRRIPYGKTASYGEIASIIGHPKASRAVGAANGRNPLPIFIPCHRVIGSNGKLVGFGGGLELKQKLLDLEQRELSLK